MRGTRTLTLLENSAKRRRGELLPAAHYGSPATDRPWPVLMSAATAAEYLGERNVRTFRRKVGKVYPRPAYIEGRGDVWRKADLDKYTASLSGQHVIRDAADIIAVD